MADSAAESGRAAQKVTDGAGIGGVVARGLTNRPDKAAPSPIVQATYSRAIPAARVIQPSGVIHPGPTEITCATIVSPEIAIKPTIRSVTSEVEVATLLPRSRAPKHTATAANPPVQASAPSASANGMAPSSGIPTIEIASTTTTATNAGTNKISATAPRSPELSADEARTPMERTQSGATTVSSNDTIRTSVRRSTVADSAASGHHPLQFQPLSRQTGQPTPQSTCGTSTTAVSTVPRTRAAGSITASPPTVTTSPSTTAVGPRRRVPPITTTSSSVWPSIVASPPKTTIGSCAVASAAR